MKRGDVVLVRYPHPSGQRGKKRPAVVILSDVYSGRLRTVVLASITTNLTMKNDPACLFIEANTPEGQAAGLHVDSVVSGLVINTLYANEVDQVLGSLSPTLLQKFDDCLRIGLGLP